MRPMNLGTPLVNNYLFPTLAGYLLVDTGYEGGGEEFFRQLSRKKIDPNELQWVFLTHAHDDHAGFLNEVLRGTRARVLLHPKALERLRGGKNPDIGGCPNYRSVLACRALALAGRGKHTFPPLPRELENRCIPLEGARRRDLESSLGVTFLDTPGHTADSMSLLTEDGSLFCGDAAMAGPLAGNYTTIWMEDAEEYRTSWEAMLDSGARMVYPGHGGAFPLGLLARSHPKLRRITLRKP